MFGVNVRCPAISVIASSMVGSRSPNLTFGGLTTIGLRAGSPLLAASAGGSAGSRTAGRRAARRRRRARRSALRRGGTARSPRRAEPAVDRRSSRGAGDGPGSDRSAARRRRAGGRSRRRSAGGGSAAAPGVGARWRRCRAAAVRRGRGRERLLRPRRWRAADGRLDAAPLAARAPRSGASARGSGPESVGAGSALACGRGVGLGRPVLGVGAGRPASGRASALPARAGLSAAVGRGPGSPAPAARRSGRRAARAAGPRRGRSGPPAAVTRRADVAVGGGAGGSARTGPERRPARLGRPARAARSAGAGVGPAVADRPRGARDRRPACVRRLARRCGAVVRPRGGAAGAARRAGPARGAPPNRSRNGESMSASADGGRRARSPAGAALVDRLRLRADGRAGRVRCLEDRHAAVPGRWSRARSRARSSSRSPQGSHSIAHGDRDRRPAGRPDAGSPAVEAHARHRAGAVAHPRALGQHATGEHARSYQLLPDADPGGDEPRDRAARRPARGCGASRSARCG